MYLNKTSIHEFIENIYMKNRSTYDWFLQKLFLINGLPIYSYSIWCSLNNKKKINKNEFS